MIKTLVIPFLFLLFLTYSQVLIGNSVLNPTGKGLLIPLLSVCSIIFIVWFTKDRLWVEREMYNNQGWWGVLIGALGSIIAVILFHLLWNNFVVNFGYLPLKFHLKEFNIIVTLMIHLSFYCLIEEMLFRGYFQEEVKRLSKHLPLGLSLFYQVIIPTVLFTIMHFFKMGLGCLLIVVPSLYFGLLKYHTRNIYSAIGAHLIFNLYHGSLMEAPF